MKKSINLWVFPYPERMNLRECMQLAKDAGFDGIELNYDLENDLSPKNGTKEFEAVRKMADEIGIAIVGSVHFFSGHIHSQVMTRMSGTREWSWRPR